MKRLEVVAAIVVKDNKFLCTQRNNNKYDYIAYKYEFPGGKIEADESAEEALVREMKEELDLEIGIVDKFMTVEHTYPDFQLVMYSYLCESPTSEVKLREHIAYKWLEVTELSTLDWAQADVPIVNKLRGE